MVLRYQKTNLINAVAVTLSFVLSFSSATLLSVWLIGISLILLISEKVKGALKALALIQVRSLISSGIAVEMSSASGVKWMCLFLLSFYIIFSSFSALNATMNKIISWIALFFVYICVTSLLISSYPVVAIAKAISYFVPFVAILCGTYATRDFDWIGYYNKILGSVLLISAVLLPFPVGYLRNGHAFQGAINHPNMYGIMLAVFLAGYLYKIKEKLGFADILVVCSVFFLIFQSESRTSLISAVAVVMISFAFSKINIAFKAIIIFFGISFILISFELPFFDSLTDFIYKGHDDIWYSRSELLENNMSRFYDNPIFGTGFNVPYESGVQSFEFSFDMPVENGNIFTALLGDLGIVGTTLFIICYGSILKKGNKKALVLFVIPFIISMGEMVFFSSNNCALILYTYFAVYLSSRYDVDDKMINKKVGV